MMTVFRLQLLLIDRMNEDIDMNDDKQNECDAMWTLRFIIYCSFRWIDSAREAAEVRDGFG